MIKVSRTDLLIIINFLLIAIVFLLSFSTHRDFGPNMNPYIIGSSIFAIIVTISTIRILTKIEKT
ncbi:MAG: hypothetical protein ACP5IZ_11915, partial [Thermoprotei archaeon]|jgi:hypothetical protein